MFKPVGLDADFVIARLRPRKVFKTLWSGQDLLNALADAKALGDAPLIPDIPGGRCRGGKSKHDPLAVFDEAIAKINAEERANHS